ncbi:MAG TPA: hypothetical protein VIL00_00095 [Pseudonocardiaceae bacterium]
MGRHLERNRAAGPRATVVRAAGEVVRWLGNLAAMLLTMHVVLTIAGANPDNGITRFVAHWAEPLALGFRDLFLPSDAELRVLVNYGIAAVFWLVVASLGGKLINRVGRA